MNTINNKSKMIYTRAMEVAAEEVAFYQSKLEKAKELFSLCERLLGGIEDAPQKKIILKSKVEESYPKRQPSGRHPSGSILNEVLPHMGSKGMKSAEIVKAAGITTDRFNYFLLAYKKYVKSSPSGQHPFKDYSLNKRGLAAKNRIKENPITAPEKNINNLIRERYMSLREVMEKTGHASQTISKYIAKNSANISVKTVPSDVRPGWKMQVYKLN
jgi:predicted DNA-binding transcriptional regulator AlpA